MKKPLALIILDGFGERDEVDGNAIKNANTPTIDRFRSNYPFTTLGASGLDVGLPDGQMGNSEVGHLNIGAGRIVYQSYTKIDKSIADGDFFTNKAIVDAVCHAKKENTKLHVYGLLSDGGVHSHINHFYALLKMAKDNGLDQVYIHAVLDGRDVPPRCAEKYINEFEAKAKEMGIGKIATVSGRYYTMDRDNRWDRVQKAYDAYTIGKGYEVSKAIDAVINGYERNENDEFVLPTVVMENNKPVATMDDGDSVISINFRPDRVRQITRALNIKEFDGFEREKLPEIHYLCMTQYDESFPLDIAYPPEKLSNIFGEIIEKNGLKQLRIAETEKYPHVTFFFNGQEESPFKNEDRNLIPSPKVATYDLQPEMSAFEVKEELLKKINSGDYDVIILNLANPDMVGHTGVYEAALKAVETVDGCLNEIVSAILNKDGTVLLTADHGNIEHMFDENKKPITAHTTNPVPFFFLSKESVKLRDGGVLADIAPTMLDLLNIQKPEEMTGKSLIVH